MSPPDLLAEVEAALVEHYAQPPARASMTFLGVEPIEVLRFEPVPGQFAYVSLGMARSPMTAGAETSQDPHGPRAELILELSDPGGRRTGVWRRLALLAAAPAVESVVYRPGLTVEIGEPIVEDSICVGVVVQPSAIAVGPDVDLLRVVPATANELAYARVHGTAVLVARWTETGSDLLDIGRSSVSLE